MKPAYRHTLHRCNADPCLICQYEALDCNVCNGYEQSLPTECPGRPLTDAEIHCILAGQLDFRGGKWVAAPKGAAA